MPERLTDEQIRRWADDELLPIPSDCQQNLKALASEAILRGQERDAWKAEAADYRESVRHLEAIAEHLNQNRSYLRDLVEDLADSLRDFGATQDERRSTMHRRAADALDRADAVAKGAHDA